MTNSQVKKILVVEDEAAIAKVLADQLRLEGFVVLKAKNGEEGLQLAMEERPDLILLDVIMPKMDGLEMLRHFYLQGEAAAKAVPVILLTNMTDDEAMTTVPQDGIVHYMVKTNWSLSSVVKRIKEVLAQTE